MMFAVTSREDLFVMTIFSRRFPTNYCSLSSPLRRLLPREHLEWQKVVFKYLHLKRVSNTTDNQEYFRRSGSEMLQLKTSPLSTGQKKEEIAKGKKVFCLVEMNNLK